MHNLNPLMPPFRRVSPRLKDRIRRFSNVHDSTPPKGGKRVIPTSSQEGKNYSCPDGERLYSMHYEGNRGHILKDHLKIQADKAVPDGPSELDQKLEWARKYHAKDDLGYYSDSSSESDSPPPSPLSDESYEPFLGENGDGWSRLYKTETSSSQIQETISEKTDDDAWLPVESDTLHYGFAVSESCDNHSADLTPIPITSMTFPPIHHAVEDFGDDLYEEDIVETFNDDDDDDNISLNSDDSIDPAGTDTFEDPVVSGKFPKRRPSKDSPGESPSPIDPKKKSSLTPDSKETSSPKSTQDILKAAVGDIIDILYRARRLGPFSRALMTVGSDLQHVFDEAAKVHMDSYERLQQDVVSAATDPSDFTAYDRVLSRIRSFLDHMDHIGEYGGSYDHQRRVKARSASHSRHPHHR